jgi:cell division cycle 14
MLVKILRAGQRGAREFTLGHNGARATEQGATDDNGENAPRDDGSMEEAEPTLTQLSGQVPWMTPGLWLALQRNAELLSHLRPECYVEIIPNLVYLVPWSIRSQQGPGLADTAHAGSPAYEAANNNDRLRTPPAFMPLFEQESASQEHAAPGDAARTFSSTEVRNRSRSRVRGRQLAGMLCSFQDEMTYDPFCTDFGPYNLAQTMRFMKRIESVVQELCLWQERAIGALVSRKIGGELSLLEQGHRQYPLSDADSSRQRGAQEEISTAAASPIGLVLCTDDAESLTNAAVLIGIYRVLCHGDTPEQAYARLEKLQDRLIHFRDASAGPESRFPLGVQDFIRAWYRATETCRFFSPERFDIEAYEYLEQVQHGDLNWIVPGKLLAFAGPSSRLEAFDHGMSSCQPEHYIPLFQQFGVTAIVRLNRRRYDARIFRQAGFRHFDLYFADGGCPDLGIVQRFLDICGREPGAIAVHCKAGLGRTGTLMCCALMHQHGFAATEAIAWCRLCRPGSVIGAQQHFLVQIEPIFRDMTGDASISAASAHVKAGACMEKRYEQLESSVTERSSTDAQAQETPRVPRYHGVRLAQSLKTPPSLVRSAVTSALSPGTTATDPSIVTNSPPETPQKRSRRRNENEAAEMSAISQVLNGVRLVAPRRSKISADTRSAAAERHHTTIPTTSGVRTRSQSASAALAGRATEEDWCGETVHAVAIPGLERVAPVGDGQQRRRRRLSADPLCSPGDRNQHHHSLFGAGRDNTPVWRRSHGDCMVKTGGGGVPQPIPVLSRYRLKSSASISGKTATATTACVSCSCAVDPGVM